MRLYRAMREDEIANGLTSTLLFDSAGNYMLQNEYLDEVYSHIVKSHSLRESGAKRSIFSFSDSYQLAKRVMNDFKDQYVDIYYIDVDVSSPVLTGDEAILFVMPLFEVDHWIELAAKAGRDCIINRNYPSKVSLINAIAYSSSSARAYAYAYREYAVVCNKLFPFKALGYTANINPVVNYHFDDVTDKERKAVIDACLKTQYFSSDTIRVSNLKNTLLNLRGRLAA